MMNLERRIEIVNSHWIQTIEFITSEYNEFIEIYVTEMGSNGNPRLLLLEQDL